MVKYEVKIGIVLNVLQEGKSPSSVNELVKVKTNKWALSQGSKNPLTFKLVGLKVLDARAKSAGITGRV